MTRLSRALRGMNAVLVIAVMACAVALSAAGCADEAQTAVETTESQDTPSGEAQPSENPYSSLGDVWTVNGWVENKQTLWVSPEFSADGKYVVTAFPAVFDAQTGDKIWEGTPADISFDSDGNDFKTATVTSDVGQFVLHNPEPIVQAHDFELPAGLESDALSQKLAARALTEGESVPLVGQLDPLNVFVAPALQDVLFVRGGGILAPAVEGSSSRFPADEEWAVGLYDVASGEFEWTRRFGAGVDTPTPLAFLSDGRVLVLVDGGTMAGVRIMGADVESDQEVALPERSGMFYRGPTALMGERDQDNDTSWGLGVDSTGATHLFKGPVPDLPTSFKDVDTGFEFKAPYTVSYASISPDGSQVLFQLSGSMWGVASIR